MPLYESPLLLGVAVIISSCFQPIIRVDLYSQWCEGCSFCPGILTSLRWWLEIRTRNGSRCAFGEATPRSSMTPAAVCTKQPGCDGGMFPDNPAEMLKVDDEFPLGFRWRLFSLAPAQRQDAPDRHWWRFTRPKPPCMRNTPPWSTHTHTHARACTHTYTHTLGNLFYFFIFSMNFYRITKLFWW